MSIKSNKELGASPPPEVESTGVVQEQSMELDIETSFNARLITPYRYLDRTFHLLFFVNGVRGPFVVSDSDLTVSSMIHVGDITHVETQSQVGFCFFTQSNVICTGSSLLAYSGVFKQTVDTALPKDFEMDLVIKSDYLMAFVSKNKACLLVSPVIDPSIKENLEV
jgi:hypothetical protein